VDVYLNGSHLSPADFTASNGSDVVLGVAASADDVCDIISYTPFEVADATFTGNTTMSTTDNSTNLLLTSTDAGANNGPNVRFYRNSATPADDDLVGGIVFDSRNDNSQDIQPVRIRAYTPDVSDGTEDGAFDIATMTNGALSNRMDFLPTETIFNNSSIDVDFRVESNANINMLFVDSGGEVTTIGGLAGATSEDAGYFPLQVGNTGSSATIIQMLSAASGSSTIHFGDAVSGAGRYDGYISYNHGTSRTMSFGTAGATNIQIDPTGAVTNAKQPAFLAQPASQQANLALNTTHTIAFGTERFDQNADFNNTNAANQFTAPVTGKYQLNVNLYLTNLDLDVSYYQFELQTSNRVYYFIQGTTGFDADVNFQQLSLCILADMDASDTAIVRLPNLNAGAAQLDVGTGSSFSGYLVA